MNYKERIAALKQFKTTVSAGETTDNVSSISSDVEGWTGDAKGKFDDYIEKVQKDCKTIAGRKATFLTSIDSIISGIQAQFDSEYESNSYILTATYDSEDAAKNRDAKITAIDNLGIDDSVKAALKENL